MDWVLVGFAGLAGAIVGTVVYVIAGLLPGEIDRRTRFATVLLAALVAGGPLGSYLQHITLGQAPAGNARELIAEALEKAEFLMLILKDHPELKPEIEARLARAYQQNGMTGMSNSAQQMGRELGGLYLGEYIAKASDDTVADFLDVSLRATSFFAARDTGLCFLFLFGGNTDARASMNLPAALTTDLLAVLTDVVRSGRDDLYRTPRVLGQSAFQAEIGEVANRVLATNPADDIDFTILQNPDRVSGDDDKRKGCLTTIALYRAIQDLPPGQGAAIFRTMLATGA